ncbi:MAG: GNAT family N-acetyltransferase [Gemmatimonadaceae bacterium]
MRETARTGTPRPESTRPAPRAPRSRVAVRPASLDDLDAVVALRIALLREHAHNPVYGRLRSDAPERARRLFAAQLESAYEVTLLAERAATPVGILRCVDAAGSPLLHPAHYAYVASVYVVPAERRAGVLRALMAEAEAWSRDRGLREMRLHNAADNPLAGAAWQALGFDVVEVLRVRSLD